MAVSRIKGTFIAQINPWKFLDTSDNPTRFDMIPLAMTPLLKFDGKGGVTGKNVSRKPSGGGETPISGTYALAKNLELGVFEGHMDLIVGTSAVTVYIVRRTADEINMNHLEVLDVNGTKVGIVANGILRREQHSWWEWLFSNDPPGDEPLPPKG